MWKATRYICFWRRKRFWYEYHFTYRSGRGLLESGTTSRPWESKLEINDWRKVEHYLENAEGFRLMFGDSRIGTEIAGEIKLTKVEFLYWDRV